MSKFTTKFAALTATIKALFEELKTINSDPVLYYEGDEAVVGTPVFTSEGPAPDGEYIAEGIKYVVAEGVITAIEEMPKEEPKAEEPVAEDMACSKKKMEEAVPAEEHTPEEPKAEEPVEYAKKVEVDALYVALDELKAMIGELRGELEKIKGAPAADMPEGPKQDFSSLEGINKVRAMYRRTSF